MKYAKSILTAALAALLLTSCAEDKITCYPGVPERPVEITTAVASSVTKPMTTTRYDPNTPAATAAPLPDGVAEHYALSALFEQDINRIVLTSGISGAQYTALDTDIARIAAFCAPITGDQPISDRGFYGSYFSVALYNGPIEVGYFYFSVDTFSTGHYETVKGHDYRIRYRMSGRTTDEVREFFARYFPSDFTTTAVPSPDIPAPAADSFDYISLTLPDYRAINPVRYMGVDSRGEKNDGWQDFGTAGELRTIPQPMGSTYLYQTYSYFIRNDLRHLYPNDVIPSTPEALAEWLTEICESGRRALWYSIGALPSTVELTAYEELSAEGGTVIGKATYRHSGDTWVVYILCEEGTASVLVIDPHDDREYVIAFTDGIAASYRVRSVE